MKHPILDKIEAFLAEIGISVIEKELDEQTFLPGLSLGPSCIYVDKKRLLYPGDLLHEAGHLAVTPAENRAKIGSPEQAADWPDQGEEIVAILWSFAALRKLDLPTDFVFHPNGYKGNSDWFIERFESGDYMGLPLLEWKGMALSENKAKELNKPAFPHMLNWLCS